MKRLALLALLLIALAVACTNIGQPPIEAITDTPAAETATPVLAPTASETALPPNTPTPTASETALPPNTPTPTFQGPTPTSLSEGGIILSGVMVLLDPGGGSTLKVVVRDLERQIVEGALVRVWEFPYNPDTPPSYDLENTAALLGTELLQVEPGQYIVAVVSGAGPDPARWSARYVIEVRALEQVEVSFVVVK